MNGFEGGTSGCATGRLGGRFVLRDADTGTGAGERGAPPPATQPAAQQPRLFLAIDDWKKSQKDTPSKDVATRKHVVTTKAEVGGELVLTMSTADVDRDHDVLDQSGWELKNYLANPVLLWAHDYSQLPIGRSKRTWVENGKALKIIPEFPTREQYALGATVGDLFKAGYINAGSVGFMPLEWSWNEERGMFACDFKRMELLESSLVPVPANPMALREAKAKGLHVEPVVEWCELMLASVHGKGAWMSQDVLAKVLPTPELLEKAIRAVIPAKFFSLPEPPAPQAATPAPAPEPALQLSIDPAQLAAEVAKAIGERTEDLAGLIAP